MRHAVSGSSLTHSPTLAAGAETYKRILSVLMAFPLALPLWRPAAAKQPDRVRTICPIPWLEAQEAGFSNIDTSATSLRPSLAKIADPAPVPGASAVALDPSALLGAGHLRLCRG